MEQRDTMRRTQPRECTFELECLVYRFAHEQLDDVLAPRTERPASEPATESLHSRESNAADLGCIAIEYDDAGVDEDLTDLVALAGLEVVVPHDGDARDAERRRDLARENTCFLGQPVIRQVAAYGEHIRSLRNLRKHARESTVPRLCNMNVAHAREANDSIRGYHRSWVPVLSAARPSPSLAK